MRKAHLLWSRPLNVHTWSDHQSSNAAALHVYEEIAARRKRVRNPDKLRKHIKVFLLDLWLAAREQIPGTSRRAPRWLGISRAKPDYGKPESRYRKIFLSYDYVVRTLDDLIALGYVRQKRGQHNRELDIGTQTRIRARSKLVRLMDEHAIPAEAVYAGPGETIILKDKDRKYVDYVETEETTRWRNNLERINAKLRRLRIRLYIRNEEFRALNYRMTNDPDRGPIDYNRNQLVRIFNNGSFREGGRFYGGWWQGVPSEYRKYLDINHGSTVEYDYSGLHLRVLYWMKGLQVPDDPYDIPGIERELQKELVLIMLNAESKPKAIKGFRRQRFEECQERISTLQIVAWMDAVAARHNPIKEYFYSGEGVRLQFRDSCVAERVMLKMLDLGRVVLPVHDSFIMRRGLEKELITAMEEATEEEFPGLKPALKARETAKEESNRKRDAKDWRDKIDRGTLADLVDMTEFFRN